MNHRSNRSWPSMPWIPLLLAGLLACSRPVRVQVPDPAQDPLATQDPAVAFERAERLYPRAGGSDDAMRHVIKSYEHIVELDPGRVAAHFRLGMLNQLRGEWALARIWYEEALHLDPSHSGALNNLGTVDLKQSRHAEAIARFEQAAALRPDDPVPLGNLAFYYAAKGDSERAQNLVDRAIRLAQRNGPLYGVYETGLAHTRSAAARGRTDPYTGRNTMSVATGLLLVSY